MREARRSAGPHSERPRGVEFQAAEEMAPAWKGVIRPRQGTGRIEAIDLVRHLMMAPMGKTKIPPMLMAIAALCASAASWALAQTAPPVGADPANAAAQARMPDAVT